MVVCIWNNLKIRSRLRNSQRNTGRRLTSSLLCISINMNILPTIFKSYALKSLNFAVRFMPAPKTNKSATYISLCLTNLAKGDKIILPLINIARVFIDFDLAKLTTLYRVVFLFQKNINFFQKSVDKCLLM